jgi:oligopeptide transport system substrate-binding protein
VRLAAALAALVLVFGACSDDTGVTGERGPAGAAGGEAGPSSPAPREDEPGATPAPPSGEGSVEDPGAVLTVAIPEPATLDPMRIGDPGSLLVARQLFEGLTRWDAEAEAVVPAAARSWEVADGGRKFTFELRSGMTFHDGSPVTARSFKFGFERIARRRNAADLAYTLDRVRGFTRFNRGGRGRGLAGIRAPTDRRLVIRLARPFHEFPAVLTHPGLVPLPKRAVADLDRFLVRPVGNGPFRMARPWSPGTEVVLEAFGGFYEPAHVDGIRLLPFADPAESWAAFDGGSIDIAEIPVGQFDSAAAEYGEAGVEPFLSAYHYGFNLRSPALRRLRLRKAVNLAIDREAIARDVYKGTMRRPRGIVPAGMPGFGKNACLRRCEHTPGRAKALARRLPPDARRITLDYTKGSPHGRVARLIRRDLQQAGFRVRLRGYGFAAYLERLVAGRQSLYRLGWIAEYPSPDAFLYSLFHSDSPDNYGGFRSRRVDRLIDRAQAEANAARRTRLYRSAERAILEQVPLAPIGSFLSHWAARPEVDGLSLDVTGGFDAARITLDR